MTKPSAVVSEILGIDSDTRQQIEPMLFNLGFAGKLEIATHRIAYIFMLAKCIRPDEEQEYRARVAELKKDINFCPEMAGYLQAAITLDNGMTEDIDECVPPEVRERRMREISSLIF